MDPSHRIVTRMPLTELWNDHGQVDAVRAGRVGEAEIVRLLISYTSGAARTPSSFGGTRKRSPGGLPIAPWVTVLLIVAFHPLFGGFHLPEILHAGLRATVGDCDLARRAALAFVNTVVVHARDCLVLLVPVDRDSLQLELHRGPSRKRPLQQRVTLLLPRNYDFASVTDRLTSGRRDWRRRRGWRDRTIAGKGREQNQRVGAH